jgi:hypothetical protein
MDMPDFFVLDRIGVASGCIVLVWMFITDKIVSGKRLIQAESDRLRWENIALTALHASTTAILPAAEAVQQVISNLPDPGLEAASKDKVEP